MVRGRKQCDPISGCGKFYKSQFTICNHCGISDIYSTLVPFNPLDWVYDLECYPNIFTGSFKHMQTGTWVRFEISEWNDDRHELLLFLYALKEAGCRMIGYNNCGYDYPLLHFIIETRQFNITYNDIYEKSASMIATPWENRFDNVVREWDVHIQQIDLQKVHHFDNKAKRVSLKELEFNMRSDNVGDLPHPPGVSLPFTMRNELFRYNDDDVNETENFTIETIEMIEFREQLSEQFNRDFLNFNDVKIGKEYIIMELERLIPGSCYTRENGYKQKRQTHHDSINIGDVIFPYIKFNHPEFQRVHQWLTEQTITKTKGVFSDNPVVKIMNQKLIDNGSEIPNTLKSTLLADLDGFLFVFGLGGIHGAINNKIFYADNNYVIQLKDVKSYYPNIAIKNKIFPAHLSEQFCSIYNDTYQERKKHKKGTTMNATLKLALNGGGFGGSGDEYCPIYDLKYMLGITVNGQLMLAMLAEYLLTIPNLQLININTDGIAYRCKKSDVARVEIICDWWQKFTCLELDTDHINRYFSRDVNSYIVEYVDET